MGEPDPFGPRRSLPDPDLNFWLEALIGVTNEGYFLFQYGDLKRNCTTYELTKYGVQTKMVKYWISEELLHSIPKERYDDMINHAVAKMRRELGDM